MDNDTAQTPMSGTARELLHALGPFNSLASLILNYLQNTNGLTDSFIREWNLALTTPTRFITMEFFKELAAAYPVYSVVIAYSGLLGVGVSAAGVFWCFCRVCCGRCGSHLKHARDAKHSKAARNCCGMLMFLCLLAIIMGCAMGSMSAYLLQAHIGVAKGNEETGLELPVAKWMADERANNSDLAKYADWNYVLSAQRQTRPTARPDNDLQDALFYTANEFYTVTSWFNSFVEANFLVDKYIESAIYVIGNSTRQSMGLEEVQNGGSVQRQWRAEEDLQMLIKNIDVLKQTYRSLAVSSPTNWCASTNNQCSETLQNLSVNFLNSTHFQNLLLFLNATRASALRTVAMATANFSYAQLTSALQSCVQQAAVQEQLRVSANFTDDLRLNSFSSRLLDIANTTISFLKSPQFRSAVNYGELYGPYGLWALLGTFAGIALLLTLALTCGACGSRDTAFDHSGLCRRTRGASLMFFCAVILFLLAVVFAASFLALFLFGALSHTEFCESVDPQRFANKTSVSATLFDVTINHYIAPLLTDSHFDFDFATFTSRCTAESGLLAALLDANVSNIVAGFNNSLFETTEKAVKNWLYSLATPAEYFDSEWSEVMRFRANITTISNDLQRSSVLADAINNFSIRFATNNSILEAQIRSLNTTLFQIKRFFDLEANLMPATSLVLWMQNYTVRLSQTGVSSQMSTLTAGYLNYVNHVAVPCAPVRNMMQAVNSSVCKQLLKHFHVVWLGMAIVALVYAPTVVAALRLDILYRRVLPFMSLPKDSSGEGSFHRNNMLRRDQLRLKRSAFCRPAFSTSAASVTEIGVNASAAPPTYKPSRYVVRPKEYTNAISKPEVFATGTPFTYLGAAPDSQLILPVLQSLHYSRQPLPPGVTMHETASFRF